MARRAHPAVVLCFVAGLITPAASYGQSLADRIDRFMQVPVDRGDFSGAVLVSRGDRIVAQRVFGYADRDLGVPVTPDTPMLVGSVSKQFTAAAILLLEQDGLLRVTDPIEQHLPGFPRGDVLTIHHLLSHRSGLAEVDAAASYDPRAIAGMPLRELVGLFRDAPAAFEPGAAHAYSNAGYVLLAHLIEVVSGTRYGAFLDSRVFEPLGMTHSGHLDVFFAPEDLAVGYDPLGSHDAAPVPLAEVGPLPGAGSIYTSAADLHRWGRALSSDRLLSEDSRRKMFTDHGDGYGYGIGVSTRSGRRARGHDGRMRGAIAAIDLYPDDSVAVIFLSNVQSGAAAIIRRGLAALAFDQELPAFDEPAPFAAALDLTEGREVAGCYRFAPTLVVEVARQDDRLMSRANQGFYSEMVPLSDGTYFMRALYATMRFERDAAGVVTGMTWMQGGGSFGGEREDAGTEGCS